MFKSKLKNEIYHSSWRIQFDVGNEYEWSFDDDVKLYNAFYNGEIVFSLKPEKFFHYFEARSEQRRKKLNRVLKCQ